MGRDRIIETYVQRLLDWEKPMTADSLSAIAQEVGLGPDDMAAVQQKAQDHFDRGRNYLEFDCLDEAIDELTQATALAPLDFEFLQTLTYAYDQRYGKRKNLSDKKQAIALAKRCLEINPSNEDAVMLISALEHEANGRQLLLWLGVLVLVIIGGFRPVMDLIARRSEVEQLTQEISLDAPGEQGNLTGTETATSETATPETTDAAVDIPIAFDQAGLTLDPRLSRLDNYDDSSYYTLQGVLLNESDQEIEALRLEVAYLDQAGTVIETDSKEVIGGGDATVRPGDHHAVDLIHKTTPALASIRLNVITIDEVPAPPDYAPASPIPYTWGFKQPAQLTFDLSARSENLDVYDLTDSAYFNAQWAVTNTGDSAIRKLKLQADFYNQQGDVILSQDVLAVYGSDAPMLPGEVRPIRLIKSIAKDYDRYEVNVLEAE